MMIPRLVKLENIILRIIYYLFVNFIVSKIQYLFFENSIFNRTWYVKFCAKLNTDLVSFD